MFGLGVKRIVAQRKRNLLISLLSDTTACTKAFFGQEERKNEINASHTYTLEKEISIDEMTSRFDAIMYTH